MTPFSYAKPDSAAAALQAGAVLGAKYLGGGTNLVDLMREGIETPSALVDVTELSTAIEDADGGGLRIGGGVKNTTLAADARVRARYPMLSRAILAGASAQIRNMATVGGNVLQRTRCTYFYDEAAACNKRAPGTGCDARDGFNRIHAILGASDACVATHPSDMCVALVALDAELEVEGAGERRRIAFADVHRLPGTTPARDTTLEPGELITAVILPPLPFARTSTYRKVRDRASYAFALVSVAAAMEVDAAGAVSDIRLALGGVAHKPWRASEAERLITGQPATPDTFRAAMEAELASAVPLRDNGFKIELARRTATAVLTGLAGATA
jgi:xanthine dehydrogenase YagS FAD-binding subunit